MPNKLQEFISLASQGLAINNRYKIQITPPNSPILINQITKNSNLIELFAQSVDLPTVGIKHHSVALSGEPIHYAREKNYGDELLNIVFYDTPDLKIKRLFEDWLEFMFPLPSRQLRYYDDYNARIQISVLNRSHSDRSEINTNNALPSYDITVHEVYPQSVTSGKLSADAGQLLMTTVDFRFRYWRRDSSQPGVAPSTQPKVETQPKTPAEVPPFLDRNAPPFFLGTS